MIAIKFGLSQGQELSLELGLGVRRGSLLSNSGPNLILVRVGPWIQDGIEGIFQNWATSNWSRRIRELSLPQIGLLLGSYKMSSSLTQPIFGYLSDRYGGRWSAVGGVLWIALFQGLVGYMPTFNRLRADNGAISRLRLRGLSPTRGIGGQYCRGRR